MRNKVCVAFGHRDVFSEISEQLVSLIEELIVHHGVVEFWTGGMGEFDVAFSSAVRQLKQKYPHVKLLLIKPYFSAEINTNKTYYAQMYDEVIIPQAVANVHPKSAITKRNRWMVEESDFVITFVHRNFGGAHEAKKYAVKKQKIIFEIGEDMYIP